METVAQDLGGGRKLPRGWRSSRTFVICVVCFAGMTDMLLYGLIVPIVPTALHERVKLSQGEEQRWTSILLALHGAAMTIVSPICGYLADRTQSRRWPFLIGLAILVVATALLCIGTNLALWIVGRLLQGAAGAMVWTVGLALLVDRFEEDALGQALGYAAMSTVGGTTAGPLLGGILYEHGGYYAPFGLAFGVLVLDAVLRIMIAENAPEEATMEPLKAEHVQVKIEKQEAPDQTPDQSGMNSSPLGSCQPSAHTAAFFLLRSPRMLLALTVYFFVSAVLAAFDSVLPLFVHDTFGWKQTAQGLIFIPLMAPHIIDPVIGSVLDRWPKTRYYLIAAALFSLVPLLCSLRYVTENLLSHKILLCALLALIGACVGIVETPVMVEVTRLALDAPVASPGALGGKALIALACGLSNGFFAAGALMGPFLGGYIRDYAGWTTMSWALAVPMGVCGVVVLVFRH
ncbi:MFS transporter [Aspergillus campestris IBT 28561]|uniref:MFS transporter n=1 Tax=Aspergillus campestris (strain IBT 28561) TaxID=1392248 RepID=A0A2I1D071_ASPC2|nr:MFS transporter [Aspergillus campestris IBT 28561]PKY03266.1 MFS transporter [Aspergillus campestris IBT 28561]